MGVVLALPGVLLALLVLFWAPALNLISRSEHKQWQRCTAEHGQASGLVPGHLERASAAPAAAIRLAGRSALISGTLRWFVRWVC